MMRAYERLLKYAAVHTASAEDVDATPTTARQFDLAAKKQKQGDRLCVYL